MTIIKLIKQFNLTNEEAKYVTAMLGNAVVGASMNIPDRTTGYVRSVTLVAPNKVKVS